MCSYLYSVRLVSLVLKNAYFKEHLSVVAFKYSLSDAWKVILGNLKYVQCLNIALMEKARFMAPMEYNPNGQDI